MSIHSVLEIKSLALPVHLGQDKKERKNPQTVVFHITLGFRTEREEELTDQLQDSVCYFAICESVKKLVTKQSFHLIEKLTRTVLQELRTILPENTALKLSVHKVKPPVPFLKGGVSYTCGDISLPSAQ